MSDLLRHRQPPRESRARAAGAALLPGALLGAHLAALLFFLNPELPFSLALLLRAALTLAPLLGILGLLVHLPLVLRAPASILRALPWEVTVVLLAVALLDGFYASHLAYYLPAGINARLIKAALWLGLAALIAFYTALLHTLHRRPYGWRSRVGLGALALASLYVMVERREAFRPEPERGPLPSSVAREAPTRLLVVGLESATLDVVLPLAQQGQLPFFAELLREGTYGRLATLAPVRREPLWLTVATGKHPHQHGIVSERVTPAPVLGDTTELRLLPAGLRFGRWVGAVAPGRPVTSRERRALTLWEILARLGRTPLVVGWPLAVPAIGSGALTFDEGFFAAEPEPALASPRELGVQGALFRLGPREIDPGLLEELGEEARALAVAALQQDLWRGSLAFFLLDSQPAVEALFLRLPGLAAFSRAYFGGYSAHQLEGRTGPQLEVASRHLTVYYRHLDAYLGQLWLREPEPPLLVVVSAHGVSPPNWWRRLSGEAGKGAMLGGRFDGDSDGLLLLRGRGIRRGALLGDGALADVAPTLLYALGLPVARDFDGRVLTGAFETDLLTRRPLTFVPSYESLHTGNETPPR